MPVHFRLEFDCGEQEDAKDRIQVEEQEEKTSNIHESRHCDNEGVEDLAQVRVSLDDLQDSRDSERPDDRSHGAYIQAMSVLDNDTEPRGDHDQEVKHAPSILEVVNLQRSYFNDGFDRVNACEHVVDDFHDVRQFFRLPVPSQRQAKGVSNDAGEDKVIEPLVFGHEIAVVDNLVSVRHVLGLRSERVRVQLGVTVLHLQLGQ